SIRMAQTAGKTLNTTASTPRILLADGHSDMREYLTRILREHYNVDAAADASTTLSLAYERAPDLVLADVMMRALHDFDLLCKFHRDAWGKIPIILYSAPCDEHSCLNVLEAGTNGYLITPFSEHQLLALIRSELRVAESRRKTIHDLRLSEERFRTLKNMMPSGVFIKAPN